MFLLGCVSTLLFSQQTTLLRVRITGLKPDGSKVKVAVFDKPKGFPLQYSDAAKLREVSPTGREVEVEFENLAEGRYAVSVYQDTNGNGKLDSSLLGIPKEPWGVSKNVKAKFKPPAFDSAAISLKGIADIEIALAIGIH